MARHKVHRMVDRLILGRPYSNVHRWMDEPYKWLGKKHRILRHDPISLFLKYGAGPEFLSGLLHIAVDMTWKEKNLKKRH